MAAREVGLRVRIPLGGNGCLRVQIVGFAGSGAFVGPITRPEEFCSVCVCLCVCVWGVCVGACVWVCVCVCVGGCG